MQRITGLTGALLGISLALFGSLPALADASATPQGLSLKLIMQDPDWLGRQPEDAWWSWDGRRVLYTRKRAGEPIRDTWALPVEGGEPVRVEGEALAALSAPDGDYDAARARKLFARNGDIFIRDLKSGALRQLTRTSAEESGPRFAAGGGQVIWQVGHDWFARDLATGLTRQVTDLRAEDDPAAEERAYDYLRKQQLQLFETLQKENADEELRREHERRQQQADPSRAPLPFYLGKEVRIVRSSLSPALDRLLVVTEPADHENGRNDHMPNYVTEDGYVANHEVRTLVGRKPPVPQRILLLDLADHTQRELDLDALPGIEDDPLEDLREDAADWHVRHGADRKQIEKLLEPPAVREVTVEGIEWTDDGRWVAAQIHSIDNKDRWIAGVDLENARLLGWHRLHDPAWINWYFNDFGWLAGTQTLWFLSEESGYSHLYIKPADGRVRRLTSGRWEVSSPVPDADGSHFYFVANIQHPGWHDIYRVPVAGGKVERITRVGVEPASRADTGLAPFYLSPDESLLLFRHASMTRPPELYVQAIAPDAEPRRLTRTVSAEFLAQEWTRPQIVEVPSSHVDRPVYARLYLPENHDPAKSYPAVMFVHGAGYLHNVHYGWSSYFREFMFHSLLTRHGYVVLDMDYRGSAGYGRDWRTAIYRRMGHPELEDYLDGKDWLVKNYGVEPQRVGIYGGSYGGFMTFMALFRAPEAFAAGASLRPVTDWAHYNHPYTSNILNTPLVDPMAYERSSPIEWAEQYANRPLAIFHGMQDDNVFYKDTVRLVQRLLELEKENYYPMFYPLDPHGFIHDYAWLDEYRRIFALFEEHLKERDQANSD